MATTQNTFNGNGSNLGPFSFTFKWLESTDIKVSVGGVLKTAGTHYNLQNLNYSTKNGGEVLFTAGNAPPVGTGNIRIYRQTDDADLVAVFSSGSAIRAKDLNDNFTQNLYVTQESNRDATTAITTADSATATANTALSNSSTALSTANTASANASAAVTTANTASTNASAAVSTANTASTNASAAVSTANNAATNAATALSTANTALSTANTASTNASAAVSTANTASTNASAAVSTANTASSNASAAVSTANTASSNASTALSTANTAISTANAAASAVANAILYDIVANVAAIPASPANNDAIEVVDSTGIQSFTPLSGRPVGFVGSSGLSVRLVYTTTGSTWNWVQYFPNDPEARYVKLSDSRLTDTRTPTDNTVSAAKIIDGAVTSAKIADGTIVNADVNASAAIAGTKISPDFGSQNVVTTGTATAAALIPTSSTVPTNGVYLPSANNVAISTNGTGRLFVDASGNIGVNAAPNTWNLGKALQIDGTKPVAIWNPGDGLNTLSNIYYSSGYKFNTTGGYGLYYQQNTSSGDHIFATTTATGTANGAATFAELARITASGRLAVGTTSPGHALQVAGAVCATGGFGAPSADTITLDVTGGQGRIMTTGPGAGGYNSLIFAQVDSSGAGYSERARINSSGRLLVGTSSASVNTQFQITQNTDVNWCANLEHTTGSTTPLGIRIKYTASSPNNAGANFLSAADSTATRFELRSNGGLANYSANNANLSDRNAKKDISPAANTWDCIKEWEIVNYRYKDQSDDADPNLGVIAQQVAESCPEVITVFQEAKEATEDQPAQEEQLGVKEQQMYWMAIKALQEAQVRIEALEAEVQALKAQ